MKFALKRKLGEFTRSLSRYTAWLLLFCGLVPGVAMAAAHTMGQAKVVVSGDLSGTITHFINPFVDVADRAKAIEGLNLTIGTGPFLGDVALYFPKGSGTGDYPVRGETQQSDAPASASLTCARMLTGPDSDACASYTGDADGNITLTQTGKTFSGTFDVNLKTVDGKHQINVKGSFTDMPLNTDVD